MYFDRFDIACAYYHFSMLIPDSVMSKEKFIAFKQRQAKAERQLANLQYKPGLGASNLHSCSENAKAIYVALIKKYIGVYSTKGE